MLRLSGAFLEDTSLFTKPSSSTMPASPKSLFNLKLKRKRLLKTTLKLITNSKSCPSGFVETVMSSFPTNLKDRNMFNLILDLIE